jgi:hypothetical protein
MAVDVTYIRENGQNPLILKRWLFLADKLERDPSLLSIPLKNIERWLDEGRIGNPWALHEWSAMIISAQSMTSKTKMNELLHFLRDDGEKARQLKSCSPFAGVLTREERDLFTCAWTH